MSSNSKSYIVIGAGWFGIRAVQSLERNLGPSADITVLELGSKDYIDTNVQTPRLLSDPQLAQRAYVPLSKAWKNATLVNVMEVKEVRGGCVKFITDGQEKSLEADGIILATGAVHKSPLIKDVNGLSKSDRIMKLESFRDAVAAAKTGVLVVGGGATGVELAGDIKCDNPGVNVTLINKPALLLKGSKKQAKMHNLVLKQLEKMGVNVLNDDYIEDLTEDYTGKPRKYTTNKGKTLEVEVAIMCVGCRPNVPYGQTEALDAETGGFIVNGALLCTKILGSTPSKPVWALGDCSQYGGRGIFADPQIAAFTASVLQFHARGTTEGGPVKYKHKPNESYDTLISIGRNGGACTAPFVNKRLGVVLKGADQGLKFIYKKEFGVKV